MFFLPKNQIVAFGRRRWIYIFLSFMHIIFTVLCSFIFNCLIKYKSIIYSKYYVAKERLFVTNCTQSSYINKYISYSNKCQFKIQKKIVKTSLSDTYKEILEIFRVNHWNHDMKNRMKYNFNTSNLKTRLQKTIFKNSTNIYVNK